MVQASAREPSSLPVSLLELRIFSGSMLRRLEANLVESPISLRISPEALVSDFLSYSSEAEPVKRSNISLDLASILLSSY